MSKIPICDAADFINGRAFKPSEWSTQGLPIIRIQNLTGTNEASNFFNGKIDPKNLVRRGDILISWSASLGVYRWMRNDAALNQHIFKVVLKPGVVSSYFYFVATHALGQMVAQVHGSTMQHITKDKFDAIPIYLPKEPEQKRIAARLEKADWLRRTRRYARQLSDTFLQSVFIEMFGDPLTNPKHWESDRLRNLCLKFSDGPFGSNLKTSHYEHEGIRVVRLQNIGVGDFIDDDKAFIAPSHFADLAKHECVPGDILIGTLGDPNLRACLLPTSIPVALNKADCVQARVDEKRANRDYVRWLLNIPSTIHLAPGMAHGQTRTRISMGQLAVLPVPVPPLPLQQEFADIVGRFERLRARQREAERQAEHLFQTLLHDTFKGGR